MTGRHLCWMELFLCIMQRFRATSSVSVIFQPPAPAPATPAVSELVQAFAQVSRAFTQAGQFLRIHLA